MRAKYGEQVRVVLAHDDEAHPHLHFWMLPDDQDARADTLHPGKLAKRAAEAEARAAGLDDREAVRVGNIALKAAMRDTLEDYWQEVGQPLGMTRDGPKRQRLTRAEWKARKQEAARIADALKKRVKRFRSSKRPKLGTLKRKIAVRSSRTMPANGSKKPKDAR